MPGNEQLQISPPPSYSEIRKGRKKEKEEYVGCAGLLLVVDAILVLYYNPN